VEITVDKGEFISAAKEKLGVVLDRFNKIKGELGVEKKPDGNGDDLYERFRGGNEGLEKQFRGVGKS